MSRAAFLVCCARPIHAGNAWRYCGVVVTPGIGLVLCAGGFGQALAVAGQPKMFIRSGVATATVAPNYSATQPSLQYPCSGPHVSSSPAGSVEQRYAR